MSKIFDGSSEILSAPEKDRKFSENQKGAQKTKTTILISFKQLQSDYFSWSMFILDAVAALE